MTIVRTLAAALVALLVAAAAPAGAAEFLPLEIATAGGEAVRFDVELAATPEERAIGLMYRRSLDPGRGMLFDFDEERMVSMWMKNTYVSLDMVFIDADRTVRHVATRTTPLSERTISSTVPVRFVLEINAGAARKLGIAPGDRVSGAAIDGR